jgi:CheY-like chemotaxis protein
MNTTVLVVDDENLVQRLTTTILERAGLAVLLVASGEEALSLCEDEAQDIQAVLLDLTMPGMDGVETFRQLRRVRPSLPVILSSGYVETEIRTRFSGEGPAGFIQKPYRANELLEKVREVIAA